MAFAIDPTRLKAITPRYRLDWSLWQKKNFNIHRGLIEFTAPRVNSIDDLARDVRAGVQAEFQPGWLRGFGFGAIIHFHELPSDFTNICRHIDTRNKRHGVWQWVIACLDEDKIAVAIHTWLHGYLRPVYDSILRSLDENGYEYHAADAEVDVLIAKLQSISRKCSIIHHVAGIVS